MILFKNYCTANNITYRYGTQNVLNLIDRRNDFTGTGIYFLHDLNRETAQLTNMGREDGVIHSGKFMLVVPSDIDLDFETKMTVNVEPLRVHLRGLLSSIACTNSMVNRFSFIPIVDFKDVNFDGWVVDYQILYRP